MGASPSDVFERYPQLLTLRGKVPDEVITREVEREAGEYEKYLPIAQKQIPVARLCDVFPCEMEKLKITLENFLGQWGNITIEELCKVCLIVAWRKPRRIFEFGTYNGMTTLQMAMNAPPDCTIYTLDIDPRTQESVELEIGGIDQYLAQKQGAFRFAVGSYFKGRAHGQRIIQLWGDSTKIDLSSYDGQMELVFVDAGHTYSYVKSDTENALRMLRPGGVIIWHDYLQVIHSGVTRRLAELASDGMRIFHLRGTHLAVHQHMSG